VLGCSAEGQVLRHKSQLAPRCTSAVSTQATNLGAWPKETPVPAHSRENTAPSFAREKYCPCERRFLLRASFQYTKRPTSRSVSERDNSLSVVSLTLSTTCVLHTSLALCYCSHFEPVHKSLPPQSRHSVTSPAWRSQQRQAIRALTSPHRLYLPGGASSPALCILPLPFPVEHLKPTILITASTCTFPPLRATVCETFGLGTDLATIEGLPSGTTSE